MQLKEGVKKTSMNGVVDAADQMKGCTIQPFEPPWIPTVA